MVELVFLYLQARVPGKGALAPLADKKHLAFFAFKRPIDKFPLRIRALFAVQGRPLATALAYATLTHALATLTYVFVGGPTLLWQWHRCRRG